MPNSSINLFLLYPPTKYFGLVAKYFRINSTPDDALIVQNVLHILKPKFYFVKRLNYNLL